MILLDVYKVSILQSGAVYLRRKMCWEVQYAYSYIMYKHKLSILSRLSDFMTCSKLSILSRLSDFMTCSTSATNTSATTCATSHKIAQA